MEICKFCRRYFQSKSENSESSKNVSTATEVKSRILKMSKKFIVLSVILIILCVKLKPVFSFNVDVKNVNIFTGPSGIYFGYSVAMLRNNMGNWLLVGAPKSFDPLQPNVKSPGVLFRCPIDNDVITNCEEVIVDTTGNILVSGTFYGSAKIFQHDKDNQWLGVAVDVAPSGTKLAVCAHRWKDSKFVARSDLLYMQGLCYELDANFQRAARLLPILVDYNSLVHTIERYPIWAYGALGQSVEYTKVGDNLVMGTPGLNDWQGGFVMEDNLRRNFTVQPSFEERNNWLIGYTITTALLDRSNEPYIIAGAPRANQNGSVYIFEYKKTEYLPDPLVGDQLGSYFGSVLCAVDVNGDSLDDILVGAPLYSTNNTEEGRVYVFINKGSLKLEKQPETLNGSRLEQARFGSAISNIGDINRDNFSDIAIGAPFEADGTGALYIYNGYSGGVWPEFTQHIRAKDVDTGLRAFGAALTLRPMPQGNGFGVGAFMSDKALVFRSRPVVAMETSMSIRPNRITATGPYLDIFTCFKYSGAAGSLPSTLDLSYTMLVDTTTPEGSVRALVISTNTSSESRSLVIRRDDFVCDESVRIFAPYQDIWRDVELKVDYDLIQTSSGGPILEKFNGKNPGASLQNVLERTIQYDKQCGDDNFCNTSLTMNIKALTTVPDYIISGETKRLEVKVDIGNIGENAYNVLLDMQIYGNLSTEIIRTQDTGDALVDCALNSFEPGNPNPLYRCRVRKPYPLKKNGELSFTLLFPLDNLISLGEFSANFSLKTAEEDRIHVSQALKVKIKVDYTIRVDSISKPEQVTLGLQRESKKWSEIVHKYSVKNQGPSPLEDKDIKVYVPAIVHRQEDLIADTYVELTLYNVDPPTKLMCPASSKSVKISEIEPHGGYAISVDCSTFPCRSFTCNIRSFRKDESLLITVRMTVSRDIISTLQARDTVRLASRIAIPAADKGLTEDQVVTMFHKTTIDMERKKISIPIWLVIVSVVSAFLVLLVIVAILVKVGFFKRKQKEELERLKERRQSRAWSGPSKAKETGSSEKDEEPEMDTGIVNPLADEIDSDETGYHSKDSGFLTDLTNDLKGRNANNGYGLDNKDFD